MGETNHEVILEKLESIKALNGEQHCAILEKVEAVHRQTSLTNGRVTKLESWRNKLIGAWVITTVILVPALIVLLKSFLNR